MLFVVLLNASFNASGFFDPIKIGSDASEALCSTQQVSKAYNANQTIQLIFQIECDEWTTLTIGENTKNII